ncbi:MAG: hypothetical protein ACSI46_24995 [Gloeotrichia echinulata DVL01]|jgi:hypothetical protein
MDTRSIILFLQELFQLLLKYLTQLLDELFPLLLKHLTQPTEEPNTEPPQSKNENDKLQKPQKTDEPNTEPPQSKNENDKQQINQKPGEPNTENSQKILVNQDLKVVNSNHRFYIVPDSDDFLLYFQSDAADSGDIPSIQKYFRVDGHQGKTQKFVVKKPAKVKPTDDSKQKWELVENGKGVLDFHS